MNIYNNRSCNNDCAQSNEMEVQNTNNNMNNNHMNINNQTVERIEMNMRNDINMKNNCNNRMGLLHQIMAYNFAITDLALFLDTHKDDERALFLHNKYCRECKELEDKYQKVYGPLTIEYPCNKWRWLEEPWPSFGLG